ncbi:d-methionine ABC transporter ATP-binding protein [Clostridium sp. CAG:167]|nr:d-methionine ABC transporter ATP-binding protein [Clostridium sp. CAG:167]
MSETLIAVKNLVKEYGNGVRALDQIDLEIGRGDIFGIIGMSGAGKSTLVRCLNNLEKPTEGTVEIQGRELSKMKGRTLRKERQKISMIFQHFNLLMQKNVLDNICFPLEIAGVKRKQAKERARELLEIVGLSDKAKSYPAQLSGGQKQRVAIARALTNNPDILLCDEATSALDPQTTQSILELLQTINKEYGITIVIITHEMSVVQKICNKVAILEKGKLAEAGAVTKIFANPESAVAKKMLFGDEGETKEMKGKHLIRVVFSENSSFEPVIGNMILHFKQPVNILYADTKDIQGTATGEMILQLPDQPEIAEQMSAYLRDRKLTVGEVDEHVSI